MTSMLDADVSADMAPLAAPTADAAVGRCVTLSEQQRATASDSLLLPLAQS